MPAEYPVDPTWLDVVATQLTRSSNAALDASRELLAHYGDTGDAATQRAVDTLVDGAADALGAVSDSLAECSLALHVAGQRVAEHRVAEHRVTEQRGAEQRVAEQRVAEQRVAEQRVAEQLADPP